MHDGRVAPFGQDLFIHQLLGYRLDRLAPFARAVLVHKTGGELGRNPCNLDAAQRVDQAGLVRRTGVHPHPRAHVACRQRRVRGCPAQNDALVVEPIHGHVPEQQVFDGSTAIDRRAGLLRHRR
jgi:hypothetical protein